MVTICLLLRRCTLASEMEAPNRYDSFQKDSRRWQKIASCVAIENARHSIWLNRDRRLASPTSASRMVGGVLTCQVFYSPWFVGKISNSGWIL